MFSVDKDLRFSQHIETHVHKVNRLLALIRSSYGHLYAELVKLLCVALVRPHLKLVM